MCSTCNPAHNLGRNITCCFYIFLVICDLGPHFRLNFQIKPLLRWTVQGIFDLNSFVGKSKSTLLAVNNLQRDSTPRYTHISSVNKANPEKIWTTIWIFWISMVHIKAYFPTIRPSNKNDSIIDLSLRRRRVIRENNHERNKSFQLPAFPTANQILWHCSNSQSALRPKSGRNEHKREKVSIRPNLSGGR